MTTYIIGAVLCCLMTPPELPGWKNRLELSTSMRIPVLSATLGSLAISPDGKMIACSTSKGISIISFPDGKSIQTFNEDKDARSSYVIFSADNQQLIGAGPGLRVWDLKSGNRLLAEKWDWERVNAGIAFNPDGTRVKPRSEPPVRPLLSPDSKNLYVGSLANEFRIINVVTGKEILRISKLSGAVSTFAASPDGKKLVLATRNRLYLYRTDTFAEIATIDLTPSTAGYRYSIHFLDQGDQLFVMGPSGDGGSPEIRILNCKEMEFISKLPPVWPSDHFSPSESSTVVFGDGRYALISQNASSKMTGLYDLRTKKHIGIINITRGCMNPMLITPDRKNLIGGVATDEVMVITVDSVMELIAKQSNRN